MSEQTKLLQKSPKNDFYFFLCCGLIIILGVFYVVTSEVAYNEDISKIRFSRVVFETFDSERKLREVVNNCSYSYKIEEDAAPKSKDDDDDQSISHWAKQPFICPSYQALTTTPKSCPKRPIHHAIYNSSLFPMYQPFNPGPSTQTNAFRHILLAAIALRKSLIYSYFTRHKTDRLTQDRRVPFGVRIDLENLCSYVNIQSDQEALGKVYDEINVENGDNPDSLSNFNNAIPKTISLYLKDIPALNKENQLIMTYMNSYTIFNNTKKFTTEFIPVRGMSYDIHPHNKMNSITELFSEKGLRYDEQKIIGVANAHAWIYKSYSKIIDEGGAYRNKNPIAANSHAPRVDEISAEKDAFTDLNLLKEMYRHTTHPKFIKILAAKFVKKVVGTDNFIGIHWRINPGDFLGGGMPTSVITENLWNETMSKDDLGKIFGAKKGLDPWIRREVYRTLDNPIYYLNKLIPHLKTHLPDSKNGKTILIASPQNIASKFQKLNGTYTHKNGETYKIITGIDTFSYLRKIANDDCPLINKWFGDLLSTFEKELMILATSFYRARPSNWSFNTQGQRFAKYESLSSDRVIYDVFLNRARRRRRRSRKKRDLEQDQQEDYLNAILDFI